MFVGRREIPVVRYVSARSPDERGQPSALNLVEFVEGRSNRTLPLVEPGAESLVEAISVTLVAGGRAKEILR
jgi:hypothetical protein